MSKNLSEYEHIAQLIYKFITGAITDREMEELDAWRNGNPRNEKLFQRMTDTENLQREYRKQKAIEVERPLRDMQERLRQAQTRSFGRKEMRWTAVAAVVAAMAAMFCIGYFWNNPLDAGTDQPLSAQADDISHILPGTTQALLTTSSGEEVELGADSLANLRLLELQKRPDKSRREARINKLTTPRGGEFKILLEDSTVVYLNAESQLVYPETFGQHERRVKVKGEAYFEVAKDSLRPFYVETEAQVVRVYGTEFNIQDYTDDGCAYTTLVEGSIALQPPGGQSQAELVLTPGHQAVFTKADHSTAVHSVDTEAITSWHKGRFVFEEQTLEQIMRTLARWYKFDYKFEKPSLARTIFKGSAPRYAKLSAVLSILEKSGGLTFEAQRDLIVVKSKQE